MNMSPRLAALRDRAVEAAKALNERDAFTVCDILIKAAKYGDVTDRQAAYVESLLAKAEKPAEARETLDLSKINQMFDRAAEKLKNPFCYFLVDKVEFKISKAPQGGANPNSLYIKRGSTYAGKIARDGSFSASREAVPGIVEALRTFAADPLKAAIAYGVETKRCARCNRTLSNPISVEAGMGPICRGFFA